MSNYKNVGSQIYNQNVDANSTTKNAPLGTIIQAKDVASTAYGSGEFVYLKGVASTALGSWVTYNAGDNSTTLLAANAIGPVAIAMSASVASE